jgi:hypothetical protein
MGMAMTGRMASGMLAGATTPSAQSPAGAPVAPPAMPIVAWHFAENGAPVGPLTTPQLAQAIAAGRVRRDTLVWSPGMAEWTTAAEVPALRGSFAAEPPPLPRA